MFFFLLFFPTRFVGFFSTNETLHDNDARADGRIVGMSTAVQDPLEISDVHSGSRARGTRARLMFFYAYTVKVKNIINTYRIPGIHGILGTYHLHPWEPAAAVLT